MKILILLLFLLTYTYQQNIFTNQNGTRGLNIETSNTLYTDDNNDSNIYQDGQTVRIVISGFAPSQQTTNFENACTDLQGLYSKCDYYDLYTIYNFLGWSRRIWIDEDLTVQIDGCDRCNLFYNNNIDSFTVNSNIYDNYDTICNESLIYRCDNIDPQDQNILTYFQNTPTNTQSTTPQQYIQQVYDSNNNIVDNVNNLWIFIQEEFLSALNQLVLINIPLVTQDTQQPNIDQNVLFSLIPYTYNGQVTIDPSVDIGQYIKMGNVRYGVDIYTTD